MSDQPVIGVTLGDPAGIGPEVFAKVLARFQNEPQNESLKLRIYGAPWALEQGARIAETQLNVAELSFVDIGIDRPDDFEMGRVSPVCGAIAVQAVEAAARDAIAGEIDAIMTCPIHKEAVHAAGYVDDIGHQEILGRVSGVTWTATMLMTPGLKVVHLSTHKSLLEATRYVTRANLVDKLRLTHETLNRWGMTNARIAVAALNPHGGEGGLLGREEIEEIRPAVEDMQAAGVLVEGPIPADSVFTRAIGGEFDVVLALYHDQGHIAIKVHNFHESVTATLGIPFIRTSVDHGTAFDIAGQGIANPSGAFAALQAAQALATGQLR